MLGKASQLFVCLFQETLSGYQGPLVGGAADFPGFVKSGHLEGDDFPGDAGDLRLCPDLQPHRGGGGVGQIQGDAHRGLPLLKSRSNGFTGCALHKGCHAGGGIDQKVAGTHFQGGV